MLQGFFARGDSCEVVLPGIAIAFIAGKQAGVPADQRSAQ
jgi:hypothetical protein